ncbi:hypothetical protein [Dyella nitratireducens]|nr:hypothetical protein [Dyella nitratireducens]
MNKAHPTRQVIVSILRRRSGHGHACTLYWQTVRHAGEQVIHGVALLEGKESMRSIQIEKTLQADRWLIHMVVVMGYALLYLPLRAFSENHWPVIAGFRMACLLLVPYRYWAALAVGESVVMIHPNMACLGEFGITWVALMSVPRIALGMPIVWWFRSRTALFPSHHQVNIKVLLCCALSLSVLWAAMNSVTLSTVQLPTGPYHAPSGTAFMYVLDNYLAMLIVVPWAVMVRTHRRVMPDRLLSLRQMVRKPAFRHVSLTVLAFTVLTFLHGVVTDVAKPVVLTALFLLVVWLTLKHGWVSVLGGTSALICMRFLLDWRPDPAILQMHVVMAFAITGLYMFGAHISSQWRQHEQLQRDAKQTQHVAQKALLFGEQRLQQTSQFLEQVAGVVCMDYARVLQRFVPVEARDGYDKDFLDVPKQVHYVAESIHPSAWRERGLAAALEESIGMALHEAGIRYSCETPGIRLRFLSEALQGVIYRMACEAAVHISASPACIGIHLTLRMGRRRGVPWVGLRMDGMLEVSQVAYGLLQAKQRERVAPKLGASARPFDDLRLLARLFEGDIRRRATVSGMRVTALLCDTESRAQHERSRIKPLIRLWVG